MLKKAVQGLIVAAFVSCVVFFELPLSSKNVQPITAQAQETQPDDQRFARLARGINLFEWFWYGPGDDWSLRNRFTEEDFATIKNLGFTFIRLPIGLSFVMDEESDDLLRHDNLQYIDMALDRALANDLAVLVDIQSTTRPRAGASNYSAGLEDPEFVELFIVFWESFGAYLNTTDPEMVFLEPMNEPMFLFNPQGWVSIQERLLSAIRGVAPEHTLIATGSRWSRLEQFVMLEPLDDPNIVYNFHFYEPMLFTHQGADWSFFPYLKSIRQVPYPSSPDAMEPALAAVHDDALRNVLILYGESRWDAAKLKDTIGRAAAWAEANGGLRLLCDEFGVYKRYASPADRAQWHHDVVAAFEYYGIGWAMWEYDRTFGLVELRNGGTVIDDVLAEALGLNPD
jgi:endoglucanase